MKAFINLLNGLEENGINYDMIHEDDQIRIVFDKLPNDYIVVTRHEAFHANNITNLNGDQLGNFVIGIAERQEENYKY